MNTPKEELRRIAGSSFDRRMEAIQREYPGVPVLTIGMFVVAGLVVGLMFSFWAPFWITLSIFVVSFLYGGSRIQMRNKVVVDEWWDYHRALGRIESMSEEEALEWVCRYSKAVEAAAHEGGDMT